MKKSSDFGNKCFIFDGNYQILRHKMKDLLHYNMLHKLTIEAAKTLSGKEIEVFSFGYAKQDCYDRFVFGKVQKVQGGRLIVLDEDDFLHFINLDNGDNAFWIGDTGRTVYYRDVKNDPYLYTVQIDGGCIYNACTLTEAMENSMQGNYIRNNVTGRTQKYSPKLMEWDFKPLNKEDED